MYHHITRQIAEAQTAEVQRTAMKEGLPGGTLRVSTEERARGGPLSCCTLVWI
jgi:hypothetical protein